MNILFALALFVTLVVVGVNAQCTTFPENVDSNVCKFGDQDGASIGGADGGCAEVNQNPFYKMSEQCYNAMVQDGDECSYAVGSYYCSVLCSKCDVVYRDPCESICSSIEQHCPTLWTATNEVGSIMCRPNRCIADSQCTLTEVDKNKIDDIIGGGDGGGGTDGNSAPGKPSLSLGVFVFGVIALFISEAFFSNNQ